MAKAVLLLLLLAAAWAMWPAGPAVSHWKGRPAPDAPLQQTVTFPKPWQKGEYTITPLASYEVTALVLAREDYSLGREADLSPMDLALGWSTMSEENIVKGLEVSQSNRWYHYHWDDAPPMSPEVIARNSSNHHLIPATPEVAAALAKVRRHSLVTLKGHLVEVTHGGGWKWRSSLSRTDTGGGACEILWVEEASVGKP